MNVVGTKSSIEYKVEFHWEKEDFLCNFNAHGIVKSIDCELQGSRKRLKNIDSGCLLVYFHLLSWLSVESDS
jgi:hypothetical protein